MITSIYGFNRPYVRDTTRQFCPIYLAGESYSFYCNSDYAIDDFNSYLWEFRLIKDNGVVMQNFGLVETVNITASVYHFYRQLFVFPHIPNGHYYFQVYDTITGNEVFRSNPIESNLDCVYNTTPVKFRHNDQLFGVRYDLLPDFWQIFRLPLNQIGAPEIRSVREQYRQSSNGRELRNTKSFRDVVMKLEMYWSNDQDLQALSALNEHGDVFISGNRLIQLVQIQISKPMEMSNQSKATFDCIVDDYDSDRFALDYYGDFIAYGGTATELIDIFIES